MLVTGQFIEWSEENVAGAERDLISIGSLEPRKNHQYLLRVLAEAKRLGHEYTLTIIGSGPLRRPLARLTHSLGLTGQVTFLGFQPRAARWLSGHRALVHSSLMESFGVVFIEAMAAARPVFAAPVGAIPEVFDDGVEGRYWPLDDPRAGAEILISLLEAPQAYARSAAAARARFERCFATDRVAPRLAEFLATISDGAAG
jgi:glycosyltransferase involved in cell wall biosynthesis